ncbi:Glutamate-gated chloride channel [Amphibalanus amphitrite]|uniref:Glutamate-gated chloride channel n=1 Tax=Amphibalanus amphitrite TaxID=1232801 RepID=A0A6A4VLK6_AMPAM|nr:Glutamate-gated chloride channel [Amphibalanus amphitrite]
MNGRVEFLTLTDPEKIWMPDLFFKNEKTGQLHEITMPNMYIRIFSDGGVLYSVRISLTLSCPMDLKLYPLDKQTCSLKMASCECEYSCLTVDLLFKREFSYYLIQIYVPCCMLVIVSWVSFWLDQNAVPARVSLGVTTLLTMATQTSGINAALPPVSYTKAIDVWTGVCLMFVFGAMLEFALVNYASRSDMHRETLKRGRRQQMELDHQTALGELGDHTDDGQTAYAMAC